MRISLQEAVTRLQAGEVVAIPTDTVYGLAVDKEQQASLYLLKGRSENKPLITLGASFSPVETPPGFDHFAKFWPGALTIVLPIGSLRIPQHPVALALLEKTGALAVTSANRSGEPPALSADDVEAYFGAEFPVLDGGVCEEGIPSTIIAYQDDEWKVLRQGALHVL